MNIRRPALLPSILTLCGALWSVTPLGLAQSRPTLSVQLSNGYARLTLTGDIGTACTIQCRSDLSPTNNWRFVTNLTRLSSNPWVLVDSNPAADPRLYRAISQQVPANVTPAANMVWIPPGTFTMGSPSGESNRDPDEAQHTVTLTKGFYMGKYTVTQGEYLALQGINPSRFTTTDYFGSPHPLDLNRPVEQVTWADAVNYCTHLTQQEQLAGRLAAGWAYRLPTESEWEYACRAGTTTAFHFGNAIHGGMQNFFDYYEYDAFLGDIFFNGPAVRWLRETAPVGSYQPNAWGLYDMHGNVWQWCRDLYGAYPAGTVIDPTGAASGTNHSVRGGCLHYNGSYCRASFRRNYPPSGTWDVIGFRVVLAQP